MQELQGNLSRRRFLKLVAPVLATPIVASCGLIKGRDTNLATPTVTSGNLVKEADTKPEISTKKIGLKEAGLEDFSGVYSLSRRLVDNFGSTIFSDFYDVLQKVTEGEIAQSDHPDVTLIRDGWGDKANQVTEDAILGTKRFSIDFTDTEGKEEDIRSFLDQASKFFPVHSLALPDRVHISEEQGWINSKEVTLSSPEKDPQWASYIFLHEATHGIDIYGWRRIKQYVPREKFIDYLETYLNIVNFTLRSFLSLPVDDALILDDGYPPLPLSIGQTNYDYAVTKIRIEDYESALYTAINIPSLSPSIGDSKSDLIFRFNKLAFAVGKRLLELNTDQRKEFFDKSPVARSFMEEVLYETQHYFVGPVFYSVDGFLMDLSAYLQRKRLRAFSELHPTASFDVIKKVLVGTKGSTSELDANAKAMIEWEREKLQEYGCQDLGEYQILENKTVKAYQLPDNLFAPERTYIFLHFNDPIKRDGIFTKGFLVSIPRQNFDTNMSILERSKLANYYQDSYDNKIHHFAFPLSDKNTLTFNFIKDSRGIGLTNDFYNQDYFILPIHEYINDRNIAGISYAPLVYTGDWTDRKQSSESVIYFTDMDNRIDHYPLPEDFKASILSGLEFLGRDGAIILKTSNGNFFLPGGKIGYEALEVSKASENSYYLSDEKNKYKAAFYPEQAQILEKLLQKERGTLELIPTKPKFTYMLQMRVKNQDSLIEEYNLLIKDIQWVKL